MTATLVTRTAHRSSHGSSRALRLLAGLLVAAGVGPVPSVAQEVRVPGDQALAPREYVAPARLTQPTLRLAEAVRLTILHSPRISEATQSLRLATGRRREAAGAFDPILQTGPTLGFTQQPIAPSLRSREASTREIIRVIGDQFTQLNKALRDLVAGTRDHRPRCPTGLQLDIDPLILDRRDPQEVALLGVNQDLRVAVTGDLQRALSGFSLSDLCTAPLDPGLDPGVFADVWRRIDFSGGLGLEGILTSVSQIPREARRLEVEITEAVAARARLAVERLGPVPIDDLQRNFLSDAALFKLLRSGLTLGGEFHLESREHNFRDKPLDPTFGALAIPTSFPSYFSLSLSMPMGRGRGRVSVAAPERAAAVAVDAQRDDARHRVAEQVFQTVLAYLNLVAAQENLRLLEESASRQQQFTELTQQLVDAGELPLTELERVRARAALVASSLNSARVSVLAARMSLAEAMGLEVDQPSDAPLAGDGFAASQPAIPPLETLLQSATVARRDTRALQQARQASTILAAGAQADLKRRFDFSMTGGMSDLYESPFFRFLPDEAETLPARPPVRYSSLRGFYRSLTGRWEPFVLASFTLEFPIANNAAKGRLLQSLATVSTTQTEASNLERVVRQNVVNFAGAVQHAADAVQRWRNAVTNSEKTLEAALQQFQAGELTLIDTLLTEEDVTRDKLELVKQLQIYFSALTRLKFETGSLVLFESEGTPAEAIRFEPAELVAR